LKKDNKEKEVSYTFLDALNGVSPPIINEKEENNEVQPNYANALIMGKEPPVAPQGKVKAARQRDKNQVVLFGNVSSRRYK